MRRVDYEDHYLGLPLIRHQDVQSTQESLSAIGSLVVRWRQRGEADRVLAFTLGMPVEYAGARCAVMARATEIQRRLGSLQELLALNGHGERSAWTEHFAETPGRITPNHGEIAGLISHAARFDIRRIQIERTRPK